MNNGLITSIAGYVRVSSRRQAKFGSSLSDQRNAIESYANAHGYNIFRIYADEGFSGMMCNRPSLMRMKEDAQKGFFQQVAFTQIDRFGRSARNTLLDYAFFEKLGISVHSIRESLDTTTYTGRFYRTILAGSAEVEWERLKEKLLAGFLDRLEKGFRIGLEPFGYSWNKETMQFEIDHDRADIYKRIVFQYLVQKKKQIQIAVELNEKGIRTKQGKKWSNSTIRAILKNPAYKGICRYKFQSKNYGIQCPPLIDRDIWKEIQIQMKARAPQSRPPDGEGESFILKDLLKCGECGRRIRPMLIRNERTRRYYGCSIATMGQVKRKSSNIEISCALPSIPAESIDNVIVNEIINYFRGPENIKRLWIQRDYVKAMERIQEKVKQNKNKAKKLGKDRNILWDSFNEDLIGKDELLKSERMLRESIEILKEEEGNYRRELARLEVKHEEVTHPSKTAVSEFSRVILDILKQMSKLRLRAFLGEILGGGKLTIRIVGMDDLRKRIKCENISNPNIFIPRQRKRKGIVGWHIEGIQGLDICAAYRYLMPLMAEEWKPPDEV